MNETIKTELYHKWSKDEKKRYNADYYQKHKEYWKARAESDSKARAALKKMQRYGKYINEIRYDKDPNPVTGVSGAVGFDSPYYDGTYIRKTKPTPRTPYGTVNAGEAQEYWKAKKAYKDARKARKAYSEGLTALEGGRDITDPAKDEREALKEMKKYKKQLNATKVKDSSYPATKRAYDAAKQRFNEARKAGKDKKAIKAADALLAKNKAMKYGNMLKNGTVSAGKEALKRMNAWINL